MKNASNLSPSFIKSSFCVYPPGGCIEVSINPEQVFVRDASEKEKVLSFSRHEWEVFIAGIKNGEFDLK